MTATIFTTTGANWITDKFDNTYGTATFFGGWGTGGSSTGATATAGDTDLKAEATESRVSCTMSQPSANINQFVYTLTNQKAGGKTVEETAIFLASGTGGSATLIIRANHGGSVLATGDAIQYTVQLTHA